MGNTKIRGKALVCIGRPSVLPSGRWLSSLQAVLDAVNATDWSRMVDGVEAEPGCVIISLLVPYAWSSDTLHTKLDTLTQDVWKRCGDDLIRYRTTEPGTTNRIDPIHMRFTLEGIDQTYNLMDQVQRHAADQAQNTLENGTSAGAVEG